MRIYYHNYSTLWGYWTYALAEYVINRERVTKLWTQPIYGVVLPYLCEGVPPLHPQGVPLGV